MAASRIIEQESGTFTGRLHPHNGYYAGDFSDPSYVTRNSTARHHRTGLDVVTSIRNDRPLSQ